MSFLRSILAVLTGIVVLTITSFAIEALAKPLLLRWFPGEISSNGMATGGAVWLVTTVYTLACIVAGGYATAWAARCAQVKHAVAMGVVQALMTVGVWISLPTLVPAWRWIAGIALIVPAAWWGGLMRAKQSGA